MAKSTLSLSALSTSALAVALLSAIEAEGKSADADTLNELFSEASSELARQKNMTRCFDIRVKALMVSLFVAKKNAGLPSSVVSQHISMQYMKQYESTAANQLETFTDVTSRVEDFIKRNTGSKRSETAKKEKAAKGEVANTIAPDLATAFLVSNGPGGLTLNSLHFATDWAHSSCLAYQELMLELSQVNNPVADDSDEEDDSDSDGEGELDEPSDSDSESVLA
jgi:hypothetical protein